MSEFLDETGWSISKELFNYIVSNYPPDKYPTLLEFGTGVSSKLFNSEGYNYIGVEHDPKYVIDEYNIYYAELKKYGDFNWYDHNVVDNVLSDIKFYHNHIDIVLVDGPPRATGGRFGIWDYAMDLNPRVFFFDDLHRNDDLMVFDKFADMKTGYDQKVLGKGTKQFGVLWKL